MASPRNIQPPLGSSVASSTKPMSLASRPQLAPTSFVGTPPVSQIPPRIVSSSFQPRSFTDRAAASGSAGVSAFEHRSSVAGLGDKTVPAVPSSNMASALTAALGSPTKSTPLDNLEVPGETATPDAESATPRPDESTFSNVADVPDEEKARVLRRHLVSAEERGSGSKTGTPGQRTSPTGTPAGGSIAGDAVAATAGDSSISYGSATDPASSEEPFPIPYDAPGGDVT